MSNYMKLTVDQIFNLCRGEVPKVKYRGIVKELRAIYDKQGFYELVLLEAYAGEHERRYPNIQGTDILELDISSESFELRNLWKVFGSQIKLTKRTWAYDHYAIPLSVDTLMDNYNGASHYSDRTNFYIFNEKESICRSEVIKSTQNDFMLRPHDIITVGFELETQSTNGYRANDMSKVEREQKYNTALKALPYEWWSLCENLSGMSVEYKEAIRERSKFETWCKDNNFKKWKDLVDNSHLNKDSLNEIDNRLRDYYEVDYYDEDEEGNEASETFLTPFFNTKHVQVDNDESVSGFEFRTIGGLTVPDFELALKEVFKLDHEIDDRCGFHIHLKVGDIKHTFDRALRQSIIQYLFMNSDKLPPEVLTRWSDSNANYFFEPDKGSQKFNFVNFHSYGTLEFRCFGNINSYEEAMSCLNLSINALQYAYSQNDLNYIPFDKWNERAKDAMESRSVTKLQKFAKDHEENIKIVKANKILTDSILDTAIKLKKINL